MALSMVEQQLIQIAAEDGRLAGGAAANPNCGRRWHSRWWWSNSYFGLQQKIALSVLEQCLIRIMAEDGNLNGGEAANPD
jgi:hypothetical protein